MKLRLVAHPVVTETINMAKLAPVDIAQGGLADFETPIKDKAVPDSKGLNNWLLENYHMVGFGSSRDVFALDDNYVLKIAICRAGLTQNAVEYHISSTASELPVAHVVYCAENDFFLMVDRAKQLDPQHFKDTYGMDFETFAEMIDKMYDAGSVWKRQTIYRKLSPELRNLLAALARRKISIYDLDRKEQWGDRNEAPVIVDYGLSPKGVEHYQS